MELIVRSEDLRLCDVKVKVVYIIHQVHIHALNILYTALQP